MYKKILAFLLLGFLVIGAASASDFKINEGFEPVTEYFSVNNETGMTICTWDYGDEMVQTYLENSSDYKIVLGDNNTYNTTEKTTSEISDLMSVLKNESINLTHGVLEIAECEGNQYIFYAYIEKGSSDDWKTCYDELMKFNENNNIKPIADAI